ncbi:MAG: efflux RND transporter periplasmic adaptor subunit [Gemmatimonadaceae bacterium]
MHSDNGESRATTTAEPAFRRRLPPIDAVTRRERRSTLRVWIGRTVFVALGVAAGWLGARRTEALGSTVSSGGWQTAAVQPREVGATVLATGVVRPKVGAQVAVGSRASGVLRRLHVTVGDRVRAGQLLAELDRVEFETLVERAEAMRLNAVAERAFAEEDLQRTRQLVERNAATTAQLSSAQRTVETTRAKEREAMAALQAAQVQLGYTSIRAPISGIVASVSTQEGETVAASFAAPTFLTIVDLSRLEVWAYVDETDIGRIQVGQSARFRVDTYSDEAFEGRVTAVRPTAEVRDNVVNYVTLIEFENRGDRLLRPEMTTTVNIVLEGRDAALAVPNGAMRRDSGGSFVLVPTQGGIDRRNVAVGFRGSVFTELLSGVQTGERVVLGQAQACEAPDTAQERR